MIYSTRQPNYYCHPSESGWSEVLESSCASLMDPRFRGDDIVSSGVTGRAAVRVINKIPVIPAQAGIHSRGAFYGSLLSQG